MGQVKHNPQSTGQVKLHYPGSWYTTTSELTFDHLQSILLQLVRTAIDATKLTTGW